MTDTAPYERATDELRQVIGSRQLATAGFVHARVPVTRVQRKWVVQDGPRLYGMEHVREWESSSDTLLRVGCGLFGAAAFVRIRPEWRDLPIVTEAQARARRRRPPMGSLTILFDIGNVLFNVDESLLPFDYYTDSDDMIEFEAGRLSTEEFLVRHPSFTAPWKHLFSPNLPVLSALDDLDGPFLATLSNTNPFHWCYLSALPPFFPSRFHRHYLSFQLGLRKPHAAIYEHVRLSWPPTQRFAFVDDRAPNLVIPARMGWATHHYTGDNAALDCWLKEVTHV